MSNTKITARGGGLPRRADLSRALGLALAMLLGGAASAQQFRAIHQFRGTPTDGAHPDGGGSLIAQGGVLIGTTLYGGTANGGTVYALSPPIEPSQPWDETVIHNFVGGTDGWEVEAVAAGTGGVIYGTTFRGGVYGYGTAFSLTPPAAAGGAWSHSVIYNFSSHEDPSGPLGVDANGVIYGTSEQGGLGFGTVYSLTPPKSQGAAWTKATLHTFTGAGGGQPTGLVTSGGMLYGTASITSQNGIVYSLSPPTSVGSEWTYNVLAYVNDGEPNATVVVGGGGTLYGTTSNAPPAGSVFSVTPPSSPGGSWVYAQLYSFNGSPGSTDGAQPQAPLVVGKDGVLFGVTAYGGFSYGTAFSLTPPTSQGGDWTEAVVYRFTDGSDGSFPGCIILAGQELFGISENDPSHAGSVWALTP